MGFTRSVPVRTSALERTSSKSPTHFNNFVLLFCRLNLVALPTGRFQIDHQRFLRRWENKRRVLSPPILIPVRRPTKRLLWLSWLWLWLVLWLALARRSSMVVHYAYYLPCQCNDGEMMSAAYTHIAKEQLLEVDRFTSVDTIHNHIGPSHWLFFFPKHSTCNTPKFSSRPCGVQLKTCSLPAPRTRPQAENF